MTTQPDDSMDRLDRNDEIQQLLMLWMWCSRSLRSKWDRAHKHRNLCLIGLTFAVNESRSGKKIDMLELPRKSKRLPVPMFNEEGLLSFWRVAPACLLEIAMGCFTKGSPLAEELDRVRQNHQSNVKVDKLFKKMTSRELRYGPEWLSEGHHPVNEVSQLERELRPLCDALKELILRELTTMDALARKILADGSWQVREVPASWRVRKTPESLLNRATRLKLWQVAQEISFRNLDEAGEVEALCEGFYGAITPAVKRAVEAQGYTVDNVVDDFLNYDRFRSREEIIQKA